MNKVMFFHIIFYNDREVVYRVRFSILHEYAHYILDHKRNLSPNDPLYQKQEVEANCFAAQLLMPEQLIRACSSRGKKITERFIIETFYVSPEAAYKRMKTLATSISEWRSRQEREYDDIILERHTGFLNSVAPIDYGVYDIEDEFDREKERASWLDTRHYR